MLSQRHGCRCSRSFVGCGLGLRPPVRRNYRRGRFAISFPAARAAPTLTTKLGTRTYEVVSVSKVLETDRSGLAATTENMITLYTCVMNQRDYRWCVKAVEI